MEPPAAAGHRIDFIIVGAEKAGTSYLADALSAHPGVSMPEHEVRYFRDPFFGPVETLRAEIGELAPADVIGIKHASYLGRAEVPERIKAYRADIKLIVTLRDPVTRCVSSYLHYLRTGQIPPLPAEAGLTLALDDPDRSPKYRDIIEFGLYATHLRHYADYFPPDQLLVLEYERWVRDPAALAIAFDFLGLHRAPPVPSTAINIGSYDWPTCVRAHVRSRLFNAYDAQMNLVGGPRWKRVAAMPRRAVALAGRLGPAVRARDDGASISDELLARLRSFYRDDVESLVRSGVIGPQLWDSVQS